MRILGLSFNFHDSAAAFVQNGEIIGAVQEERFTRIKHDPSFPIHSINYLLDINKINDINKFDKIAFYENPFNLWYSPRSHKNGADCACAQCIA